MGLYIYLFRAEVHDKKWIKQTYIYFLNILYNKKSGEANIEKNTRLDYLGPVLRAHPHIFHFLSTL
jgi:hypothetical protein